LKKNIAGRVAVNTDDLVQPPIGRLFLILISLTVYHSGRSYWCI